MTVAGIVIVGAGEAGARAALTLRAEAVCEAGCDPEKSTVDPTRTQSTQPATNTFAPFPPFLLTAAAQMVSLGLSETPRGNFIAASPSFQFVALAGAQSQLMIPTCILVCASYAPHDIDTIFAINKPSEHQPSLKWPPGVLDWELENEPLPPTFFCKDVIPLWFFARFTQGQ